ncbi:MAG: ribonuclease P protein component [bacterium]|nr:ribonuclease P protein component [bacterium]
MDRESSFPKRFRLLRSSEFRRVYREGTRIPGSFFLAFCLERKEERGPRVGFTAPRALGGAVVRNRIKRRMREAVRARLWKVGSRWEIVFNPRKSVLTAPMRDLEREVDRIFRKCKA